MTTPSESSSYAASGFAAAGKALEVENCVETYKVIADWIRFADAKAGVTLTVNGIFLGLLVPTLKSYFTETAPHAAGWRNTLVVLLFLGWLLFLTLSAISAFLCVLPIRGTQRQLTLKHGTHFHPAAVSQTYALAEVDRFVADCQALGMEGVKREILCAILVDSHLSSTKYGHVTRSIQFLGGSILFGFLYLLATQL